TTPTSSSWCSRAGSPSTCATAPSCWARVTSTWCPGASSTSPRPGRAPASSCSSRPARPTPAAGAPGRPTSPPPVGSTSPTDTLSASGSRVYLAVMRTGARRESPGGCDVHDHVAWVFDEDPEWAAAATTFVAEGVARGERVYYGAAGPAAPRGAPTGGLPP